MEKATLQAGENGVPAGFMDGFLSYVLDAKRADREDMPPPQAIYRKNDKDIVLDLRLMTIPFAAEEKAKGVPMAISPPDKGRLYGWMREAYHRMAVNTGKATQEERFYTEAIVAGFYLIGMKPTTELLELSLKRVGLLDIVSERLERYAITDGIAPYSLN